MLKRLKTDINNQCIKGDDEKNDQIDKCIAIIETEIDILFLMMNNRELWEVDSDKSKHGAPQRRLTWLAKKIDLREFITGILPHIKESESCKKLVFE